MRVFITGVSGVGKTTVTQELARRGFTAYDTDEIPGLARLELRATGEPVDWPTGQIDWGKYAWNIIPEVLEEILSQEENIFLSGVCGNQDLFYNKFGKLIVLTVDPETHLHRMRSRPYRGSNDDEINIQQRVAKYEVMLQRFLDSGFIPVDNSDTAAKTADNILRIINE